MAAAQNNLAAPTPTLLPKRTIETLASEIAKSLKYKIGSPIEDVVRSLGGSIVYQDIDDWYLTEDGSIVVEDTGKFKIFLSNFTSVLRNRFTIAHELGHYFLHYLLLPKDKRRPVQARRFMPDGTSEDDNKLQRAEWEANWFASGFLMPEKEFIKAHKENDDIDVLAAKFFVSRSAIEIRIKTIRGKL